MEAERLLGDDPVPENMVIITDGEDRPLLERADILSVVMEETLVFGTVTVRGVGRCVRWDIAGSDAHGLELNELGNDGDFLEAFEARLRAAETKADALERVLRRGRGERAAGATDEYCTLQPDELSGLREVLRLRPNAGRDGAIEVTRDRVQVACNALRAIREATLGCSWSVLARTPQGKAFVARWGVKVNPVLADITPPQLRLEILGIEGSGEAQLHWNQSRDWTSRVIQWRSGPGEDWQDLHSPSPEESSTTLEGDWSACEYSLLVHVDRNTLRSAVQSAADLLASARASAPFWAPEGLSCERGEEEALALQWVPPTFPGVDMTRVAFQSAPLDSNEWEDCVEAPAQPGRHVGIPYDSSSGCRVRARFLRWGSESPWSEAVSMGPESVPSPPVAEPEEAVETPADFPEPPAAPVAGARLEDESQFDRASQVVRDGVHEGKLLITWKCPPHAREDGWSAEIEVSRPSGPEDAVASDPKVPATVEAGLASDGDAGEWLPLASVPASREKYLVGLEGGASIGSYRVRFTGPNGAASAWAAAPLAGPGCLSRLTGSGWLWNLLKVLLLCLALYLLLQACGAGACRSIKGWDLPRFPWPESVPEPGSTGETDSTGGASRPRPGSRENSDPNQSSGAGSRDGASETEAQTPEDPGSSGEAGKDRGASPGISGQKPDRDASAKLREILDRLGGRKPNGGRDPNGQEQTPTEDDRLDAAGVVSGEVSVTLSWDLRCDLDLLVTNPSGELIYFNHKRGTCGGTLDVDQNSSPSRAKEAPVEQVSWPDWPPEGEYKVEVVLYQRHAFEECQGEIPFKVRLRRPGMEDERYQGRFETGEGIASRQEVLRFLVNSDKRQGAAPGAGPPQPPDPAQPVVPGDLAEVANRVADDLATLGALLVGGEALEALPRLEDHDSRVELLTSTVESLIQQEEIFEIPRDRLVPLKDALSMTAAEAARQRGMPLDRAGAAVDEQRIGATLETAAVGALEALQESLVPFMEVVAPLPDARRSLGQVLTDPRLELVMALLGRGDSEEFLFFESIPSEERSQAELLDIWSSAMEQPVPGSSISGELGTGELGTGDEGSETPLPQPLDSDQSELSPSDGDELEESLSELEELELAELLAEAAAADAAGQPDGADAADPPVESGELELPAGESQDAPASPPSSGDAPLEVEPSGDPPAVIPGEAPPSAAPLAVESSGSRAAEGQADPEPGGASVGEAVQRKPGREDGGARQPEAPGSVWRPRPIEAVSLEVDGSGEPPPQMDDSLPSSQRPSGDELGWRSELDWQVPGLELSGDRRLMLGPVVAFELSSSKGEGVELLERTAADKLRVAFSQGGWKVQSVSAGGAQGQAGFALYLEALPRGGTNSAIPIGTVPDITCASVVSREATRLSVFGGRSAWWFSLAPPKDAATSEPKSTEGTEEEVRWSVQSSTPTRLAAWVVVGRNGESILELDPKPGCGPIEVEAWSGDTLLARSRPIKVEVEW